MLMKCNANISVPGAMQNANEMQMKCNAHKCEKMHNSGSDPMLVLLCNNPVVFVLDLIFGVVLCVMFLQFCSLS